LRKYGPDASESQKYPGLVRGERAGRCVKSELRSLTRRPEVETPKAGSAAGAETDLQSFMQADVASGN
jgi:hypothetical protein